MIIKLPMPPRFSRSRINFMISAEADLPSMGEKFKQDISDPMALSCPATVSYLLDNLFIQPLNNEEKIQLHGRRVG